MTHAPTAPTTAPDDIAATALAPGIHWGDSRPSDRAGPRRVALLSVHTSPLDQPGGGDSGGMNVYVSALSRHLAATGVEVEVFTRANRTSTGSVPAGAGVRVHHIDAGPPDASKLDLVSHLCAFALGVMRHPAINGVDVLHAHYWMSGWVGRMLRQRLGLPLVQTFHTLARQKNAVLADGDIPEPALRSAAEERVVRDSDALVVSTPEEAALLRDRYGALPGDLHVVSPGVDLELFPSAEAPRGGDTLLFVGRLQPLKGPDVAIQVLAALDEALPRTARRPRLVIVGGTSGTGEGVTDPAALRGLAHRLGVGDRVEIQAPRPQRELGALYTGADVVVMPSTTETFGLVALEAQASGTPVVATDVDGLRAVVGEGGTLVASRDPRDWAAAIVPYLTDLDTWRASSRAGIARARAHTWSSTAQGVLDVYDHVLVQSAELSVRGA